jgi:bacterial/archaeal transporter family-2 protein
MTAISYTFCCLAVVAAGISVALQQVLNANLRSQLESPWWAGFDSYIVGTIVMLTFALTSSPPRLSSVFEETSAWLSWTGGLFGAIFIATAIFMVPRLGAATVLALIVVGQMLGSLTLDQFGILGLPQHSVSPTRLIGAAFLILGVILIRI